MHHTCTRVSHRTIATTSHHSGLVVSSRSPVSVPALRAASPRAEKQKSQLQVRTLAPPPRRSVRLAQQVSYQSRGVTFA